MIEISSQEFQDLLNLSGIHYHGYKYDCDYWRKTTGVDPRRYAPKYIRITCHGLTASTQLYRDLMDDYRNYNNRNYATLGVK